MQAIDFFQGWRQREVLTVLVLAAASVVFWRIPLLGPIFYPFQIFATFVHEISHGLTAILTGGDFQRFVVRFDQSGTAWYTGGIRWIVTSSGYLGCALFGGFLIVLSGRGVSGNTVLSVLGIALGILCLVFVRNFFGIVSGLALAGLLFWAGSRLNVFWADMLLLFLGVQTALNALNSVFDLILISTRYGDVRSDAQIMYSLTGIPAPFWAVFWTLLSLALLVGALILAYRNASPLLGQGP